MLKAGWPKPHRRRLDSNGPNKFICNKCDGGFRREWDLMRHSCKPARYACPYCRKKDNSSSNVYRHLRRWHPNLPLELKKLF